jgi:uncharacterized membrane protein
MLRVAAAFFPTVPIFLTVLVLLRVAALAMRVFLRFASLVPLVFFFVAIAASQLERCSQISQGTNWPFMPSFKEAVYWQDAPPLTISLPGASLP